MDVRYSTMDAASRARRQLGWKRSRSRIQIRGAVVAVLVSYDLLDVTAGETVRIRLREYHRGPDVIDQFFPDATIKAGAVVRLELTNTRIMCPGCGETIELVVDGSVPLQEYIEDCQVCCRPMVVRVEATDRAPTVTVRGLDD